MQGNRNLITFGDAYKRMQPTAFSTTVKPVGALCNLNCAYCYYLDKSGLFDNSRPKMSDSLLELYIRQYIEANEVDVVTFNWHGGEPLVAGIDFFHRAVGLQRKYADGKRIENTIQTNGTLITEEWCDFFYKNNFLVGVSIDGPRDIHDAFRRDNGGVSTFDRVVAAIEKMKRLGVEFNTLSTVNRLSEGRGGEVYRFLCSLGSRYMQFLPVAEFAMPEVSVSAKGFGEFMCGVFDEWVARDVGRRYVQLFDAALAAWTGYAPTVCVFSETCGNVPVVEHNGDVYSCDHFVRPEYKIGNITDGNLAEMFASHAQFRFSIAKRNTLPRECLRCRWNFVCRGECPKHRFAVSTDGEAGMNSLCEGYKLFFNHVEPRMVEMARLLERQLPPALVMANPK